MGRTVRKAALLPVLFAIALAGPATAQVGLLLGSTDGTYCKTKSKNRIEADSWLGLSARPEYVEGMSLRRLASLSRSHGFSGFRVESRNTCGVLKRGKSAIARRCLLKARMSDAPGYDHPLAEGERWYANVDVFALTDSDAPSYPMRTGLLARGSTCVIE